MNVKIIILRRVPREAEGEVRHLLLRLRELACAQPGYVCGENLINFDDPEKYLVASTWKSLESWNLWLRNEGRLKLQSQVDLVLGTETIYQPYMTLS